MHDSLHLIEEVLQLANILEKWFYDEREFYSYLVFDGSKELFDLTVRTLKDSGVFVYHKGKSFQPASDGKVYDWFIRLKKDEAPSEKVSFILINKNLLPVELPVKDKKDETIEHLNERIAILSQKTLQSDERYEKLKKDFQTTQSELFSIQKKIKIKDAQIIEQRLKYESLLKENEIYKQKTEAILKKSTDDEDARWDKTRVTFLLAEIYKNKQIIENYKKEKEELEEYYNKTFNEFYEEHQKEIQRLEFEKESLRDEIENQRNTILNRNNDQAVSLNVKRSNRKIKYEILSVVFGTILPNKKIINEKQVFEYFEEDLDVESFANRLKDFDTVWKGTKLEAVDDWWEEHLIYSWRLYYKKIDQQWHVYVGLKKDQKKDISFLRNYKG